MTLPPFPLEEWLAQKHTANPPIEFDLGSSTGPTWTLRELLTLSGDLEALLDTNLLYTPSKGTHELREAIAAFEGADPDDVVITTGAAEALFMSFMLAAGPGVNVVLPMPGFPANAGMAEILGIEIRYYHLRAKDQFRVDPAEIRELIDGNTRLLLVNSPHNPTGAVLSDAEMETLHDLCAARGVQFVSDQVYHPIYYGAEMRTAARLERATVLGDLSKALCLSGLRTGWIVEPDSERRKQYAKARTYLSICGTALGERLATLALRRHEAIHARARQVATANLAILDGVMANCSDVLDWVRPLGGMTAFPWIKQGGDARELCRGLARNGVLVAPGDCFGMPAHLRIGFAASGDNFPAGIARFAEALTSAQHA